MALEARFFLAAVFAVAATCLCLSAVASAFAVPSVAFDEGYSPLFGDDNLVRSSDDKSVRLLLDRRSGSGFISSDYYLHGFFSASIKLPKAYTAGVVVAFYQVAYQPHALVAQGRQQGEPHGLFGLSSPKRLRRLHPRINVPLSCHAHSTVSHQFNHH
uniref:GH16 domain-containing protein n=1 Tax=Oryza rufipogon TaxID=4529 RepID=A0A0E0NJL6_ORYRU